MGLVNSAKEAIQIANETLEAAGLVTYIITDARLTDGVWTVRAYGFGGKYIVKIDSTTGDTLSLESVI